MNLIISKSKLLHILSIALSFAFFVACDDTETTDETDFALYYTGMTDIGPSMTGVISTPSYIGGKPSGFEIFKVTLDGESYSSSSFVINEDEGAITISETGGMPVGLYKLSIRCYSNGKMYEFTDIIEINMMKPVPDGITVEPNKLTVDYADVIDVNSTVELPTAQVTTDGNHVSIKKYEIAKSDFSKYFAISSSGEISIVRGDATLVPGIYILSLKLTTGANGEDEGIFENAIEVNVTSRPLELIYTPAIGKIEEETALSGKTTFTSNIPTFKGSLEGLTYAIKNITPSTNKILINAENGVLSVNESHGLKAGTKYIIDINVKNIYSTEGIDFETAFELEVVEFIEPIQNFKYDNIEAVQAVAFEQSLSSDFKGDEVRFEFVDLPTALQGKVSLDHEGKVSALKGNSIPLGSYTIKVKATNPKSDPEQPDIATFTLVVKENPNYFTYVHYGNNLGLTPTKNFANQYRITDNVSITSDQPVSDAKVSLSYELTNLHQTSGSSINSGTGIITFATNKNRQCGIIMVTATAGKGTPEEFSVQTPVFVDYSILVKDVRIEYNPFVFQVNPTKGGRSVAPSVTGVSNMANFTMDYRRTFNYFNFFGSHVSGVPAAGSFAGSVWETYFEITKTNLNYGSRNPMSYYANSTNLETTAAYVDPNTREIVVNPNKWVQDGEPANGAMTGQITFGTDGKDPQSGSQVFPIILWFDKNF
ncbi:hypothetical protein M2451_001635 [Dysgonomonas sp. PFB1-18]|uniref:surface glycan-binding family protein n=1 Tax=unclassified Dysgonomonas TaxID=2630389 RepID=UPI002477241E|nr:MULTISPECIES: surface glycan-binding family protein [unclassified Dysgonomonas]MDH6308907.1 hypothetical protein [Dysgonomonas sp. PF1-14]MDH6338658.1 hypothetical protein [Dysgonomonas sp. PF1-16]MDH6380314.1 hypothetical protein [Dysgonomonas sp. PFB1-18]MDH6397644.1 hypothetical protein [Dysgonomonas sp. PF1-23]